MSDTVNGADEQKKIDPSESSLIVGVTPSEFAEFDRLHNHAPLDDRISRQMLSGSRVAVMSWGVPCIGLKVDDVLISVNVTNFSKSKRKNAWGRYLNFYLAYTVPEYRHQGYASRLVEHVERTAIEQGYNRMKSLAGSYAGVRLHMRFGHTFWGIAKKGEFIVDTPLKSGDEWPEGIPIEARNAGPNPHRMDLPEMAEELHAPRFGSVQLPSEAMAQYIRRMR
jgi:GNAT superfamily N-acetyltransferase